MSIFGKIKKLVSGAEVAQAKQIISTAGESQNDSLGRWKSNQDIYDGLKFCATMQLRTPLRVLLWHGKTHKDKNTVPPKIATEMWEGIWMPNLRSFRELGIDIEEPADGTMASDIGQIPKDGGEYLKFLIAVRKIVEAHDPIDHRIKELREMPMEDNWKLFVSRYGPSHISERRGMDWIVDRFFPRFIDTFPEPEIKAMTMATRKLLKEATRLKTEKKYIEACDKLRETYSAGGADNAMIEERLRLPMYLQLAGKNDEGWAELNRLSARYADQYSLSKIEHQMKVFLRKENNEAATNPVRIFTQGDNHLESTSEVLIRLGLDTPNRITAATDETLLGIKGIGQARLKAIRDYCAKIADSRDDKRVERDLTR